MPMGTKRGAGRSPAEIVAESLFSVFNLIILGITGFILFFYFKSGDQRLLLDCFGMVLVALLNTVIAIVQELRAKAALDKVNMLLKRRVVALRGGREVEIEVDEVRVGERLLLRRGDQAVADGPLEASEGLEMDESLLTGESVPVRKAPGEDLVLSGSFAVAGSGVLVAEKVGEECYAARVTDLAKKRKFVHTPLQRRIDLLIKLLFGAAVVLVALQFAAEAIRPSGIAENDLVRKVGAILISLVPQGLVLFSSVTFALGVFRISRIGAIVQKLNAIESFSNVRAICMDKTGTLTQNRLSLRKALPLAGGEGSLPLLGAFAALSTERNATIRALEGLAATPLARKLSELPFSSDWKFSAMELDASGSRGAFLLGASDILLERCPAPAREAALGLIAAEGLGDCRLLLFARLGDGTAVESLRGGLGKAALEPLAIVAISDTPRPDAAAALERFRAHGIALKVLSGDAAESIAAVMGELGWKVRAEEMVLGSALDAMDDAALARATAEKAVFARLRPEHKLRLIKAFRKRGEYVAMIGDGVNDLPAIKEAQMGIAMEEGSSITREVSDIVLLQNKFSLLPEIFDEGNKIVNTVKSVAKLFLTKNFMVIAMTVLSLAFSLDFPLTPRRVSLLNMFGIGLPALILAMRNSNVARTTKFFKEVLGYVAVSAVVIVGASYAVAALAPLAGVVAEGQRQMAMMWVMIFLFVVNFVLIARDSGRRGGPYLAFAAGLLGALLLFSTVDWSFGPYAFAKSFYEIETVQPGAWPLIAAGCAGSGLLLAGLQWLRGRLFGPGKVL